MFLRIMFPVILQFYTYRRLYTHAHKHTHKLHVHINHLTVLCVAWYGSRREHDLRLDRRLFIMLMLSKYFSREYLHYLTHRETCSLSIQNDTSKQLVLRYSINSSIASLFRLEFL